jgi:L-2,4-diaminobutyrate decarboxylase
MTDLSWLKPFDAAQFRAAGHVLVDLLAEHLAQCSERSPIAVLPSTNPEQQLDRWAASFQEPLGEADLPALWRSIIDASNHLHHPRYIGHQVTSPLPVAALTQLLTALLNNSSAVFEMSPVATVAERHVIRWMATRLGFGHDADGTLCSGGSIGNLTGLLAAREIMGRDRGGKRAREAESAGSIPQRGAVLVSSQAHYSIARAARIMGLGELGAIAVPVDDQMRMQVPALKASLDQARAAGREVFAVVASACTTATGSFDPLRPIAELCREHNLWLHVDGAHAASAVLSDKYRPLVDGIELADSVVWDAHKMMLMPALVTGVIFRQGPHSYEVFSQQASYLFEKAATDEWYNLAQRSIECTKASLSVPLYVALRTYGESFFGDYVTRMFDLAHTFASMIRASGDFELAVQPQANIVCFRYRGSPAAGSEIELDALQKKLRMQVLESGEFYLVQTALPQGTYLRVTLINPRTDERDLQHLLTSLRRASQAPPRAR